MVNSSPRVVITGVGTIGPLGLDARVTLDRLRRGDSGIAPLKQISPGVIGVSHGAEAWDFSGGISDYGELEKARGKAIRKGKKMMCRDIAMGVAAAQRALGDAKLETTEETRDRIGVIYGTDYIVTAPTEITGGVSKCTDEDGEFQFSRWGSDGLAEVNPLWLLKYLPNMPASHIAIYNDLRGPNNSLTLREASPAAAMMEAYATIIRGNADAMVVGATGTRIHPVKSLHASLQEKFATDRDDPTTMSRPFDASREGVVLGEGAGAVVCETLEHAQQRGATILAEVVGVGCSCVGESAGADHIKMALVNVMKAALGDKDASAIGHIHAHGLGDKESDVQESAAIAEVFGSPDQQPPVTTAKGHMGHIGCGAGMVEIVTSTLALGGNLFPIRNLTQLDPECPINACTTDDQPAGDSFLSMNVTRQGQASAVCIQQLA